MQRRACGAGLNANLSLNLTQRLADGLLQPRNIGPMNVAKLPYIEEIENP